MLNLKSKLPMHPQHIAIYAKVLSLTAIYIDKKTKQGIHMVYIHPFI